MKKIFLILLLVFFGFFINNIKASHLLGADLTYVCSSNNTYTIRLTLYRDCNGISPATTQTVNYESTICGISTSITLNPVGTETDITPLCPSQVSACDNSTGTYGIEEYVYEGTFTLPTGCEANDWVISWDQCCRNDAINTITNPGSEGTAISAHLDNSIPCNSSPTFNNPPSSMVCINQPVIYNHGVSDIDGDSLYFTIGDCYDTPGATVNYSGSYSGTNPFPTASGITVDPNTGAISFTPTQQIVGVICIKIQEYRGGALIGEINRDMQFTVINCSNQPPVSSGVDGTYTNDTSNYEIIACTNSTVCFNINAQDPDGDNVTLSWNNEIPTATFTPSNNGTPNASAMFCWTPSVSDVGLNFFTVNVTDDGCPVVGSGTYTYAINVIGGQGNIEASPDDSICVGLSSTLSVTTNPTALSLSWSPSNTLSNDSLDTVIATPTTNTTYVVTGSFPSGCIASDTVRVLVENYQTIFADIDTNVVCYDDSVTLISSGGTNWEWINGAQEGVPFLPPAGTSTYYVYDTLANGCLSSDSVSVTVYGRPNINAYSSGNNICLGQQIRIGALGGVSYDINGGAVPFNTLFTPPYGSTDYIVAGYNAFGCASYDTITIIVEAPYSVVANSDTNNICIGEYVTLFATGSANYSWDNGVQDGVPFIPPLGSTDYVVSADSAGCASYDTITINVSQPVNVTAHASDYAICEGDSIYLYGTGASTYTWDNGVPDSTYFVPSINDTTFIMQGELGAGCPSFDTVSISIIEAPNVIAHAYPNDTVCEGDSIMLYGTGASNPYTWSSGVIDSTYFLLANGSSVYTVEAQNSTGCVGRDTITVATRSLPNVVANASDTSVCAGDNVTLTGAGAQNYTWDNGNVTNGIPFTPPAGTSSHFVEGEDIYGCINYDTIFITANTSTPIVAHASDTSICIGESIYLYATGFANSYNWSHGLPDSAVFQPNLNDTVFVVEGIFSTGCPSFDTIKIKVNNLPAVVALAYPNDSLCNGDSIMLYGSGAINYNWSGGVIDSTYFYPSLGSNQYFVEGTDNNGCISFDTVNIETGTETLISANASDTLLCEGESVTLYGSGALGGYIWNNGVQNNQAFVPSVGNNEYIVSYTNVFGCIDNDTINITVNALPLVVANTTGNNLCAPATITLTGSGADTYTWVNSGISDGVPFAPPIGTTNYIVIGEDATTTCTNSDTIAITIYPLPTIIPLASPNDTLCEGESLTLTANGATPPYNWNNGVTNGIPFVPPVGATAYTVTASDANSCTNDTSITIHVFAKPTVSITPTPNDSICEGGQLTLTANGAINYTWSFGANGATTTYEMPNGVNSVEVIGVVANNCADTANINLYGYPTFSFNQQVSICEDETYTLPNGTVVNTADTYPVTFQTQHGCDSIYYITVSVNLIGEYTPMEDDIVCDGNNYTLSLNAQNIDNISWFVIDDLVTNSLVGNSNYTNANQDGLSFTLDTSLSNNLYFAEMTDECGRMYYDTMKLEVFMPHPVENGYPDTIFCEHEIYPISIDYNGYNYSWNNGENGQTIYPTESMDYIVTFFENYTDCELSDTINVFLEDCIAKCVVLTPTGFSPNNDNVNDEFKIVTSCDEGIATFNMQIYNRWGELVFATDNWRKGWNGKYKNKDAEIGVYSYFIEYSKNISNEEGSLNGNFTLIR
ncbi:MAG: gliding motility-associated C-terminal domain-containing protein [Chitinophagales bacterium]|nr:gliding motility-associated C-terminal domain-containing protein [Chitinophagales bacterium]